MPSRSGRTDDSLLTCAPCSPRRPALPVRKTDLAGRGALSTYRRGVAMCGIVSFTFRSPRVTAPTSQGVLRNDRLRPNPRRVATRRGLGRNRSLRSTPCDVGAVTRGDLNVKETMPHIATPRRYVDRAPRPAKSVFRTGRSGRRGLHGAHVSKLWSVLPDREGIRDFRHPLDSAHRARTDGWRALLQRHPSRRAADLPRRPGRAAA